MKKCFLILTLLFAAQSAQANWTAIDTLTKPGVMHYFDAESLQKIEPFRKIWILSSYEEKQKGGIMPSRPCMNLIVFFTKPGLSLYCYILTKQHPKP